MCVCVCVCVSVCVMKEIILVNYLLQIQIFVCYTNTNFYVYIRDTNSCVYGSADFQIYPWPLLFIFGGNFLFMFEFS